MKRISLLIVISMLFVMALSSCGGSSAPDLNKEIIGTWTLTSIIDPDGNEMVIEDFAAANGIDVSGLIASYTFADDGSMVAEIGGIGVEATYEITSDTTVVVTFISDEATSEATFNYDAEANILTYLDTSTNVTSILTK